MEIWAVVIDKGSSSYVEKGDVVRMQESREDGKVVWETMGQVSTVFLKKVRLIKKPEVLPDAERDLVLMLHPEIGKYLEE